MDYKKYIKDVPNFPKEGILFRDITPLMGDGEAFYEACCELKRFALEAGAEVIVGPESRGFLLGCPIAYALKIGFVPIRKPHKLPRKTIDLSYQLEYGENTLCIHADAIQKGQKVVIIDDLLATGGTVEAAVKLVEKLGGIVVGIGFLIELEDLLGRNLLKGYNIKALVKY